MVLEVLQNLSLENKRKFLKFTTGCSLGPVLGFEHLVPQFEIGSMDPQYYPYSEDDDDAGLAIEPLPTSSTCTNTLFLPPALILYFFHCVFPYSKQILEKLLYAINSDAGLESI